MPRGGPKANIIKIMQGTDRKCRMPEQEPEFDPIEDISPPKYLDGLALETWQWAAPLLRGAKILTEADTKVLELYCYCYQNFRVAQQQLNEEGPTIENESGMKRKNPAAEVVKQMMSELRQYSAFLGLDPLSRGRLDIGRQKQKGNPFTDL